MVNLRTAISLAAPAAAAAAFDVRFVQYCSALFYFTAVASEVYFTIYLVSIFFLDECVVSVLI